MHVYSFEKLESWRIARHLAVWIYKSTEKFPLDEKFGLVSQMRRSAVSIASNIAEGTSRFSTKEQIQFYSIAYGSAIELLNQMIISYDLQYLNEDSLAVGRENISKLTMLLSKLKIYLQNKLTNN
jgi:four helix bundle protein